MAEPAFRQRLAAAGLALALLAGTPAVAAGDAERGQQLANQCIGCHNVPNLAIAFPVRYKIPRIQGQSAEYIKYALQEYAAGTRYDGEQNKIASMPAIASSLTEQDIEDLAAYYSSLEP